MIKYMWRKTCMKITSEDVIDAVREMLDNNPQIDKCFFQ